MREKLFSFSLPNEQKKQLEQLSKNTGLSMAAYIKMLIIKCYRESENAVKHKTGRGNKDPQIYKAIEFFRKKHPKPILPIELAHYLQCSQPRAMRIIDILSGNTNESENTNFDFLLFCDDDELPLKYSIFRDNEKKIFAL